MTKPPTYSVQLGKGGVGKTATAVALGEAAAEAGAPVLLVDSDPQGSLVRWGQLAEADGRPLRSTVAGLASKDLASRLPIMSGGYAFVGVDGPPGQLDIVRAGVEAADIVVMPVPPRPGDFDRVHALLKMAADSGRQVLAVQTFVRRGTNAAVEARAALADAGVRVAETVMPLSEPIAQTYGQRPRGRLAAYGRDLLAELLDILPNGGQP
ncbi:MAG: AAA family ATPase [Thermoanaerobaculia bacterium]